MIRKLGVTLALTALLSAGPVSAQKVNLMLSTMPAGKDPQRYQGYVEPKYKEFDQRSIYLTMRDGVRIAIDIVLPKPLPADE
jgi:predicted acyl esterase